MEILLAAAQPLFRRAPTEVLAAGLEEALQEAGHRTDRVRLPWGGDGQGEPGDLRSLMLLNVPGRARPERRALALDLPAWIWARDSRRLLWLADEPPDLPADRLRLWRASLGSGRGHAISATAAALAKRRYGLDLAILYPPPPGPWSADLENAELLLRWQPAERRELALAVLRRLPGMRLLVSDLPAAEQSAWRSAALAAGLGERVRLRELPAAAFLQGCRCVLATAGFSVDPTGAIAALAAGRLMVVAGDAGAPLELIVHQDNGLVSAPDPDAIAATVELALRDRDRAAGWEAAALARSAGFGTWPEALARLLEGGF